MTRAADLPTREQFIAAHRAAFATSEDFAGRVYDAILKGSYYEANRQEIAGVLEVAKDASLPTLSQGPVVVGK